MKLLTSKTISLLSKTPLYVGLGYALIFVLALTASFFAYYFDQKLNQTGLEIEQVSVQRSYIDALQPNMLDRRFLLFYIINGETVAEAESIINMLVQTRGEMARLLSEYQKYPTTQHEKLFITELLDASRNNQKMHSHIIDLIIEGKRDKAMKLFVSDSLE